MTEGPYLFHLSYLISLIGSPDCIINSCSLSLTPIDWILLAFGHFIAFLVLYLTETLPYSRSSTSISRAVIAIVLYSTT